MMCNRKRLWNPPMPVWLWSWNPANSAWDTNKPWRHCVKARPNWSSLPTTHHHSGKMKRLLRSRVFLHKICWSEFETIWSRAHVTEKYVFRTKKKEKKTYGVVTSTSISIESSIGHRLHMVLEAESTISCCKWGIYVQFCSKSTFFLF